MSLPTFTSGMNHMETRLYETDRDNSTRREIDGITDMQVDWDIDRSGSKSRIDIATHKRVLDDGMWVAPYLRIVPEVGDIIDQQMGHFRLKPPDTVFDGSVGYDGIEKVEQSATGGDIADLLADASLPYTFYTPRQGHVMTDIRALIRMATCGAMGPNLIPNHSFEQDGTGWTTSFTAGGTGTIAFTRPNETWDYPDGLRVFRTTFGPGTPANGGSYATNTSPDTIPIPAGTQYLYMDGHSRSAGNVSMYMELRFHREDGTVMPSATWGRSRPTSARVMNDAWVRHFAVADVPEDAVSFRLWLFNYDRTGGLTVSAVWDDVRVGTCTSMPLPDSRINLPGSNAVAATRIQTTAGSSIGYDAINADRLAATGHFALYTDLTGRLTTSPTRELADGTETRVYTVDDYRLVGNVETTRSANNRFNTVTAIKESFEDDVAPMEVTVWNNDMDDPWSVHHLGNVRYPGGPLSLQDAVNESALESAALATLARATMQQTLRIQVLPDPTLTVHSVIRLESPHEEVNGLWLVEHVSAGLTPENPLVEIGARRSLSSVGVSHGS